MRRSGLTLIEVMIAVALASSISAIGFTGVVAFGRAITRAKQFSSETQLITTAIRASIASADNLTLPSSRISTTYLPEFSGGLPSMTAVSATRVPMPVTSVRIPTPKNWTVCTLVNANPIPDIAAVANVYPLIPGVTSVPNASVLAFYFDLERQISGMTDTTTEQEALALRASTKITTGNVSNSLNMSQISCRNTLTIQSLPCIK